MEQKLANTIKELVHKNQDEYLLFELDQMIYIIEGGQVYSVLYVNDLVTEVRMNRNDQAFKAYIKRVSEVKDLYKAYRLQVLYWLDFDKDGGSRKLVDNKLGKLLTCIGDTLIKIDGLDEYLMDEVDLDLVHKSIEENLVLF